MWQLMTAVFLHWCPIRAVPLTEYQRTESQMTESQVTKYQATESLRLNPK
jgi:hypothetical protein